jgi:hypothetical protein
MVELFASADRGKVFLEILHDAGVITPWSAPGEEWDTAMKLLNLTESVVRGGLTGIRMMAGRRRMSGMN